MTKSSDPSRLETTKVTENTWWRLDAHGRALAILVLVALALRMYGIWNADHSDEYNEVFEALRVCSGHLNLERWAKRFYLYVLSVEYGIYYAAGRLLGVFASPFDFAARVVRDLSPLLILGRATSAVLGSASVYLTYRIGTLLFSRSAGLLGALFFSLNVVHTEISHHARVDATLCFMMLLAFSFIARIQVQKPNSHVRSYLLTGLFTGIAFQTKAPAIVLVVPFFFAHFFGNGVANPLCVLADRRILFYALFLCLGLVIGNPAVLVAPERFVMHLIGLGSVYSTPINETMSEHIGLIAYMYSLYHELGIPLSALALYALIRGILSKRRMDLLLLSFIIPFYLVIGISRYLVGPHYLLPMMPILYLLCAAKMETLLSRIPLSPRLKPALCSLVWVVLLLHPAKHLYRLELSLSGKNTRVIAKEWIEANIPPGSRILMDSGKSINSFAPTIAENRASIERTLDEKRKALADGTLDDPTLIVDNTALLYYELLLQSVPEKSYDITSTKFGLELRPIDEYVREGYRYFVISQNMKTSRTTEFFAARHPEASAFYRSLDHDRRLRLIWVIGPTPRNQGDAYLIYKVSG
ncbi:MAG: glycosyltransferase family 39 protein [candidate division WOR-3 bacterium]